MHRSTPAQPSRSTARASGLTPKNDTGTWRPARSRSSSMRSFSASDAPHPVGDPLVAVARARGRAPSGRRRRRAPAGAAAGAAWASTRSGRSRRARRGTRPRPLVQIAFIASTRSRITEKRRSGSVPWLRISSRFQPAPDAELEAPAREPVERGHLLGQHDRVVLDHQADAGADLDPLGGRGRERRARRTGRRCGCTRAAARRRAGYGVSRLTGMCVCSVNQSDSKPRSSTSRASSAGLDRVVGREERYAVVPPDRQAIEAVDPVDRAELGLAVELQAGHARAAGRRAPPGARRARGSRPRQ